MSDYRKEFPDFPEADMPATMPPGFDDTSWHNDTCPSFTSESLGVTLFIDFLKPDDREFPETDRFTLHAAEVDSQIILSTDDWNVMVRKIADMQSEMDRQAPPANG